MKFLLTKELQQNKLLSLTVLFFVTVLSLFLLSDLLVHHFQVGLTPVIASETILGNEM